MVTTTSFNWTLLDRSYEEEDIPQSSSLSARHICELRWFAVTRARCSSPLSLLLCPFLLYYSLSLPCLGLRCFRFYLSMCPSPLFPSPSLFQTVDWYGNTTLCIFSTATDGAVAACQRPERSLSQLSGRSP